MYQVEQKLSKHGTNELYSAIVAGVKKIYLATPSLDSAINPAVVTLQKCGVKKIYKTRRSHYSDFSI